MNNGHSGERNWRSLRWNVYKSHASAICPRLRSNVPMMDRTWYDPLGDHAAKWNVKPKDSHTKLCPHILVQPVRKDSGHFLDMRRDTKIRPCNGRISTIARSMTPSHPARVHGSSAFMRTEKVSCNALILFWILSHESTS